MKAGEYVVKSGIVFNIQRFCIHDGDGIRTCVFLKGCPLRCIWCHNPESISKDPVLSFNLKKCSLCGRCISACPARTLQNGILNLDREKCIRCGNCTQICLNGANEIIGKDMTSAQVVEEVLKDKIFYDMSAGGVTVTGGEPSYQAEFTLEILQLSKEAGVALAVETCGIGSRDFYKKSADLGTTFLFDIKCINPLLHRKLTGADNTHILSNLHYLMDRGADIVIRLPLVPGCNDSDEDIVLLADFLNKNQGRYRYAEIMPYHSLGIGKSENTGLSAAYIHGNAGDAETSRWCSLFNLHGIDIKVSN